VRPDGYHHRHQLRVRFAETDAQTIVYHANFLIYCETARTEYLRQLAGPAARDDSWRRRSDFDVALAHVALDFRAPARFDDELTIWTRMAHLGHKSYSFEHKIYRDATLVCEAKIVLCAVDHETRQSKALPPDFKQALASFEAELARAHHTIG
jgi:acyl-CoA thioester hydrolase